jgi:putative transcriptional regulator
LLNEVQKFRKGLKITQEELAKKVGVTRQTIISIEQGKYIASLSLALKIANVFDAKVEDIFTLEEGD